MRAAREIIKQLIVRGENAVRKNVEVNLTTKTNFERKLILFMGEVN